MDKAEKINKILAKMLQKDLAVKVQKREIAIARCEKAASSVEEANLVKSVSHTKDMEKFYQKLKDRRFITYSKGMFTILRFIFRKCSQTYKRPKTVWRTLNAYVINAYIL